MEDKNNINKISEQIDKLAEKNEKAKNFYVLDDKSDEIKYQKQVNVRFFRLKKKPKAGSQAANLQSILNNLIKINDTKSNALLLNKKSPADQVQNVLNQYIAEAIPLDGYSARSVIIALTQVLNQHNYIPTVIFKIGETHILCISNPMPQQKANMYIEVIDPTSLTVVKLPHSYGNGKDDFIATKLNVLQKKTKINLVDSMRKRSKEISSFSGFSKKITNRDDILFLDYLNFLRAIFEIARRGYRGESTQKSKKLDGLPIGISQTRTSKLLSLGKITIDQAYGYDRKENYYDKSKKIFFFQEQTTSYHLYKSPYGAVTGKSLVYNTNEVINKINRINEEYNKALDNDFNKNTLIFETRTLMRKKLAEEFGGSGESSGSDYSDFESEHDNNNSSSDDEYPSTPKCLSEDYLIQIFELGNMLLTIAQNEQEENIDLLNSEAFEKLCEVIDYLKENDHTKIYYNELANSVADLQQTLLDNTEATDFVKHTSDEEFDAEDEQSDEDDEKLSF